MPGAAVSKLAVASERLMSSVMYQKIAFSKLSILVRTYRKVHQKRRKKKSTFVVFGGFKHDILRKH